MSTEKLETGQILVIRPKMGIIPELTKQNYETIARQLRELITNALDAKAENIYIDIQIDGKFTDMIIADDGFGMDDETFLDQFLALGGSKKYSEDDQIGRIGIGFLACAPLCENIEIHSRAKGSNRAFIAVLYSKQLYEESFRYEGMDEFSAGKVLKVYEDADGAGLDGHFTRIVLKNLTTKFIGNLNNKKELDKLKEEFRRLFPLPYPKNNKLFTEISSELRDLLIKYSDPWRVNLFFNGEELTRRVYGDKEEEDFKDIYELKEIKAKKGSGKVTGYFIQSYKFLKDWDGLISRFQNTTVEDKGYLGFEKKKSALRYVTGELFLSGLDKNLAISINRNQFNEANEDFIYLRDVIHEHLDHITSAVYRKSRASSKVRKEIKKKKAIKEKLTKVSRSISEKRPKKPKQIQKELVEKPIKKIEATNLSELSLEKELKDIEVKIVKKVPKRGRLKEGFTIEWEGDDRSKPVVLIEKKLVEETGEEITIDDKLFKVYFIEDSVNLDPCKINYEEKEVIFNRSHPALITRDEKVISFIFLLTYFYDKTKTKADYRKKIIDNLFGIID